MVKRNWIIFSFIIMILVLLLKNILDDKYTEGRVPMKDEDRYLLYVNTEVFTEVFNEDWLKVVNNSKSHIKLCTTDKVKFNELFIGKDSLFKQTISEFNEYGFELGNNEKSEMYVALPKYSKIKENGEYVVVPVWLIVKLIDAHLLDIKKNLD